MAYLTFSTVMCLIGFQCPYIVIQFAWLFAYLYLRFYKKNSSDAINGGPTYGDRSETFAFVQWFPPFVQSVRLHLLAPAYCLLIRSYGHSYPISILSNVAFNLATRFHLIPTSSPDAESGAYAALPGPSGTRAEAERRRYDRDPVSR